MGGTPVETDISLANLRQGLLRDYLTQLSNRSGLKAIIAIGLLISFYASGQRFGPIGRVPVFFLKAPYTPSGRFSLLL